MSFVTVCAFLHGSVLGKQAKVLSLYLHPVQITDDQLDEAIAPILSTQGPFDVVHVSGAPEQCEAARSILLRESAVRERLTGALHSIDTKVVLITWSFDSASNFVANLLDGTKVCMDVVDRERRFALYDTFSRYGGLVTAGRGTHFTKPSGAHSLKFLRAANVLEGSAVTHQLVFWLYPQLRDKSINRIVVDTSGISTVAYSLAYERLNRGISTQLPVVETHASYGGLDALSIPDPDGTVFLVSASTSGKLVAQLLQKGALPENVFTLFFLGDETPGSVLCDLTPKKSIGFHGVAPIENYDSDACPECARHSFSIPIVGDQFRTEPAQIEEITILLKDFDEESRAILDRLASTGLFKVFRESANRSYEIFLDVEAVLTEDPAHPSAKERVADLRLRLDRLLRRGMPVHLKRIVHTSYPGARQIAGMAHEMLPANVRKSVAILPSHSLLPAEKDVEAATMVVSGCLDDTYELMAISRDLRTVQPGGSITYVSPFFRSSSEAERKRIESNLTFGDQGPKTFSLLSVISIDLPHCSSDHTWVQEYRKLRDIEFWCELNDEEISPEIVARIEVLAAAPAKGLSDDLYWPTPFGEQLRLAADFTMIPTDDGRRPVSQADVFVIASSLFHKYRAGVGSKPKLVSKSYERTVLSPESFQRFSDGVLHAAFLRASRGGEIAYGNCTEDVSERMLNFLCVEIGAVRNGGGHALMEFLIAILIGRLTMHALHKQKFLRCLLEDPAVPNYFKTIARFIASEGDRNESQ